MMNQEKTLFDRLITRIKNNTVIAVILVAGTFIIALSAFTDAAQKIASVVAQNEKPDISGKWATPAVSNAYDNHIKTTVHFDLEQKDGALFGTVTDLNERNTGYARGIVDGTVKGNAVYFYTVGQRIADEGTVPYKETYHGTIGKNEIAFIRQNDVPTGGLPEKFVARRK